MQENKQLAKFYEFILDLGLELSILDELGVIIKKSRYVFATTPEIRLYMEELSTDFFSIGLPLGEIKKDFLPTPALIEFLSNHSTKKVVVDKKSEWMFLCKKDIFTKGVKKILTKKNRGRVFVQNEFDENLGIASFSEKGNVLLKNILDKGAYIRKEA